MKIHKKIKIGIPEIGTFFCSNFQNIVNLKLKFWGYNENNMGFNMTPKNTTSGSALGDGRMQWEHTTLRYSYHFFQKSVNNFKRTNYD